MVYKKKRYTKARRGGAPLSKRQYVAVKRVANKQIHKLSELKTLDDTPATVQAGSPTASSMFAKIAMPVQGLASDERIGDSIYFKKIALRSILTNDSEVDLSARVVVCQTMDNDNTYLRYSDVFQDPVTAGNNSINSFYVTNPTRKFKIIHDSVHHWDSNPTSQGHRSLNVNISGKQLKIHKPDFDQPATGNCTGQLWYTMFSNTATKGNMAGLQTRVRYFDN